MVMHVQSNYPIFEQAYSDIVINLNRFFHRFHQIEVDRNSTRKMKKTEY